VCVSVCVFGSVCVQLKHPAFPVYVSTSVCTQLPCREINGVKTERGRESEGGKGRDRQRETLNWSLSCRFGVIWKKLVHVFVLEVHMCEEKWFKPSTAGNLPFFQTHIATMGKSRCEPNGYRHKQLEAQTKPASACVKDACNPPSPNCKIIFWLLEYSELQCVIHFW